MEQSVWVLLAMVAGYVLKNKTDVNNKLIPILLAAGQFIAQLLLEIKPAEASVFGKIGVALGNEGYGILVASLANTLVAVGLHSSMKNSGSELLKQLKANAAMRLAQLMAQGAQAAAEKAAKEAEKASPQLP